MGEGKTWRVFKNRTQWFWILWPRDSCYDENGTVLGEMNAYHRHQEMRNILGRFLFRGDWRIQECGIGIGRRKAGIKLQAVLSGANKLSRHGDYNSRNVLIVSWPISLDSRSNWSTRNKREYKRPDLILSRKKFRVWQNRNNDIGGTIIQWRQRTSVDAGKEREAEERRRAGSLVHHDIEAKIDDIESKVLLAEHCFWCVLSRRLEQGWWYKTSELEGRHGSAYGEDRPAGIL